MGMVLCYHCHLVSVLCRRRSVPSLHPFDFYEIIFTGILLVNYSEKSNTCYYQQAIIVSHTLLGEGVKIMQPGLAVVSAHF